MAIGQTIKAAGLFAEDYYYAVVAGQSSAKVYVLNNARVTSYDIKLDSNEDESVFMATGFASTILSADKKKTVGAIAYSVKGKKLTFVSLITHNPSTDAFEQGETITADSTYSRMLCSPSLHADDKN